MINENAQNTFVSPGLSSLQVTGSIQVRFPMCRADLTCEPFISCSRGLRLYSCEKWGNRTFMPTPTAIFGAELSLFLIDKIIEFIVSMPK